MHCETAERGQGTWSPYSSRRPRPTWAIQFSTKMGFETVANPPEEKIKAPLAKKLGAHHYLDAQSQTPPASWKKNWAELRIILSTVNQRKSGERRPGRLGASAGNSSSSATRISRSKSRTLADRRAPARSQARPSGSPIDSQDTLAFSALTGVRPMTGKCFRLSAPRRLTNA